MILQDDARRVQLEAKIANTAEIKIALIVQWIRFSPNDCCDFKRDHWKKSLEEQAAIAVGMGMPEFGSAL